MSDITNGVTIDSMQLFPTWEFEDTLKANLDGVGALLAKDESQGSLARVVLGAVTSGETDEQKLAICQAPTFCNTLA